MEPTSLSIHPGALFLQAASPGSPELQHQYCPTRSCIPSASDTACEFGIVLSMCRQKQG